MKFLKVHIQLIKDALAGRNEWCRYHQRFEDKNGDRSYSLYEPGIGPGNKPREKN